LESNNAWTRQLESNNAWTRQLENDKSWTLQSENSKAPKLRLENAKAWTLTCIAAADRCEGQQPRPLPQKNCLVCLAILFIHNDVDDGVDAGWQVQHDVAQHMETCKHAGNTTLQP
jgi:hypothetical protein